MIYQLFISGTQKSVEKSAVKGQMSSNIACFCCSWTDLVWIGKT